MSGPRYCSNPYRSPIVQVRYASWNPLGWAKSRMDDLHKERQRVKKQASTGEVTGSASLFARKTPATPSEATHSADSPTGSLPQLETSDKKTKSPPLEVYLHASQKPPKKKENKQIHAFRSDVLKVSPRKLNLLSRQIAGKPVDHALLQLQFSEKRISTQVMHALLYAKGIAVEKKMDPSKLIVAESWVDRTAIVSQKLDPRGRGHQGIRQRRHSKIRLILKEGKTEEQKKATQRRHKLRNVSSAGLVREYTPLRNPSSMWAW